MNFNLITQFKIYLNQFLDLIYKRKCAHCACVIPGGILCKSCLKLVQNMPPFAQGVIEGKKVYSAFFYDGAVKSLIKELKFKHNKACAHYIALYLKDYLDQLKENGINFENPVIVPVPTHKKHINKRGYNNVLEIAKELVKSTGYRLNSTCLIKKEYRKSQYELTRKQRQVNPLNSFELKNNFNKNDLIIILDDIITTGGTMSAIVKLFKEIGAENLVCLTFAKTK